MICRLAALAAVLITATTSSAAEMGSVNWAGSVDEAWRAAERAGRPMIVFVTREGCLPCARMKTMTFVDRQVAALMNERFVAVIVDGAQPTPLLQDLQVHAVPATFVISPKAVILDRIDGFASAQQFASRLATAAPRPPADAPRPSTTARAF